MTRLRMAILISGRGSNMQAILDAAEAPDYPAEPVLVLSNRPEAAGLNLAQRRDVATACVDHRAYGKDRAAFERQMHQVLVPHHVQLIVLAGFMRVLTPWFVDQWAGHIINIHPSLLPKYPGLKTHQRALEAGDDEAGCSVHWVTAGVDEGAVIAQARVPIAAGETAEQLAGKVLLAEHKLYPQAIKHACEAIVAREKAVQL
ncbi:MAG: phosphoribosylglycinamide formyltransferase [Pseudomonadota bacterium]